MLELKNVTINLKNGGRTIVDDFSFTLNRGEKAVIIGEEGNGKSTLLKFIFQQELIEEYCDCSGNVIAKGKTAYLPQTMDESCGTLSLAEYFEASEYYMHTDVLAKLLMDEPDVLLLDEPTRNFSPLSGPVVRAALCGFGGTIISISHDRKYLAEVCDKIYELCENGLVTINLQRC